MINLDRKCTYRIHCLVKYCNSPQFLTQISRKTFRFKHKVHFVVCTGKKRVGLHKELNFVVKKYNNFFPIPRYRVVSNLMAMESHDVIS